MVIKPEKEEKKTSTIYDDDNEANIIRFVVRPRVNVSWGVGTIDNETMGKRKSKACCIYNKPHTLDSSSSSDEDDCCPSQGGTGKDQNRYDRLPKHQRRAMRENAKKQHDHDGKCGGGGEGGDGGGDVHN